MNKTALIAGATGLVGKHIISELIAHHAYTKIIVLSRRSLNINHPKLIEKIIDFNLLEHTTITGKVDECYCALGTTQRKSGKEGMVKVDYEFVAKLTQLCKFNSIPKLMVVSSQGANPGSAFFYLRTKGLMEEAVKSSGVNTVYLIRPSLITGKREEFRLTETLSSYLYKIISPLMIGRFKKLRPVQAGQIARCMIALAQKDEKGSYTIESDFIQQF